METFEFNCQHFYIISRMFVVENGKMLNLANYCEDKFQKLTKIIYERVLPKLEGKNKNLKKKLINKNITTTIKFWQYVRARPMATLRTLSDIH